MIDDDRYKASSSRACERRTKNPIKIRHAILHTRLKIQDIGGSDGDRRDVMRKKGWRSFWIEIFCHDTYATFPQQTDHWTHFTFGWNPTQCHSKVKIVLLRNRDRESITSPKWNSFKPRQYVNPVSKMDTWYVRRCGYVVDFYHGFSSIFFFVVHFLMVLSQKVLHKCAFFLDFTCTFVQIDIIIICCQYVFRSEKQQAPVSSHLTLHHRTSVAVRDS